MKKLTNFEIGQKSHQIQLLNYYKKLGQKLLSQNLNIEQFASKISKIHLKLEDLSDRDILIPHFYNYRGFQKALPQVIETVFRLGTTGSLLIMDVDHLKRFNDTYGHLGGSRLLKIYAEIIEQVTRNTDLKAKLSGDEFCIFLVGANDSGAHFVAERIRNNVVEAVKKHFPDIDWKQTVSIGICEAQKDLSPELLLHCADLALYQAKQERNKVVIFHSK